MLEPAPEWLLDLIRPRAKTASPPLLADQTHTSPAASDPAEVARLELYAATVAERELGRLDAMREAATVDGHGYRGERWQETTFKVACNLLELGNSTWANYSREQAHRDVFGRAPRDESFGDVEIMAAIESAVRKVGDGARTLPIARPTILASAEIRSTWAATPGVRVDPILTTGQASPVGNPDEQDGRAQAARPALNVTNSAVVVEWMADNLGRGRNAGYFRRTGDLVFTPRVGEQGYVPAGDEDDDGPAQVRRVDAGALQAQLQYRYQCYRTNKDGESSPALLPRSAAQVAVDGVGMLPHLRTLRGVVHAPTIRPDGSILSAPGFDDVTGLLHLPEPGLHVPPVSVAPSRQEIAAAVALLERMFCDFRFPSEHDKANLLGLLLTPTLRAIAPPPYKLGAIGAPQPGAGKTLVATVLRIVHGGVFRAEMPSDDNELRKVITSILDVTTGPVVHFDNATGVLRSSTLAALLTSGLWEDRRLGGNEMVSRPNDRLYVVTGNNLALGGDLLRRALFVTIDPGIPNPHLRTGFAIPNLETWVREHRGEIIHALLTLVRAWVAAGRPTRGRRSSDGYALWIETVDGVLQHAGIAGTFDDPASAGQEVGSDDDEWRDLLAAIHGAVGSSTWTAKEMLARVDTFGSDPSKPLSIEVLPGELADRLARSGVSSIARPFGIWLRNRVGRWAGAYSVRQVGKDRNGIALWRVDLYKTGDLAGSAGSAGTKSDSNAEAKSSHVANGHPHGLNGLATGWESVPALPAVPAPMPVLPVMPAATWQPFGAMAS